MSATRPIRSPGAPIAYAAGTVRPDRVVSTPPPLSGQWCAADNLDLTAGPHVALASGHTSYAVDVQNTGTTACTVPGRLGLESPPGWLVSALSTVDAYLSPGQTAVASIDVPDSCAEFGAGTVIRAVTLRVGAMSRTVPGTLLDISCGAPTLTAFTPPAAAVRDPAPGTLAAVTSAADMPASVRAGQALTYTVTLTNDTDVAVPLSDCPTFTQRLTADDGSGAFQSTGRLNCGAAGQLAAHSARAFRMVLPVPTTMMVGTATIRWWLDRYPARVFAGGQLSLGF